MLLLALMMWMMRMMTRRWRWRYRRWVLQRWREKLNGHIWKVLSRYSHFCMTLGADGAFAQLAENATWANDAELGAKTKKADFSLLNILFDMNANGKTLKLSLGDYRTNMHNFFERQWKSIGVKIHAPLIFVEGVLRPWVHWCQVGRGGGRWIRCSDGMRHHRCERWCWRWWQLWVLWQLLWRQMNLLLRWLSRFGPRWWNWLAIMRFLQTLAANNGVSTYRSASRFALCR